MNSFAWKRILENGNEGDGSDVNNMQQQSSSNNLHNPNDNNNNNNINNNKPRSRSKRSSDTSETLRRTYLAMASQENGIRMDNGRDPSSEFKSALELRNQEFLYVQGMNVLAAPFLYQCKTEAQAFSLFYTFLTRDCPLYICPTLEGAHTGLMLVDFCLEIIDPTLFEYLQSKFLSAELYAFTSVLTFSAGTPPLSEALILWDFLFAYGPHLNILFVIAQLTLIRSQLFEANSPMSLLRNFPQLKAREIIKLGISFVPLLPDSLYDLLQRHTYDPSVGTTLKRHQASSHHLSFYSNNNNNNNINSNSNNNGGGGNFSQQNQTQQNRGSTNVLRKPKSMRPLGR